VLIERTGSSLAATLSARTLYFRDARFESATPQRRIGWRKTIAGAAAAML
jgi:hypothetical protein